MEALPSALLDANETLVVVAPHPDDDVLGCGALLASAATERAVRVVYVTDGAASHRGSASYPPARLRAVREREALLALERLGVRTPPHFLRWPDGEVPAADDPAALPLLSALTECIPHGPVVVASPWRRDPHADHRAVASLVNDVLRDRPRARRIEYAVWLGVLGDADDEPRPDEGRTVSCATGPWLRAKRAALREHHSQLGELVTDADWSFAIPETLLDAALGPHERYVLPLAS